MEQPEKIAARFEALSDWMAQTELWAPRPFVHHRLPWEADHPSLSKWLRGLTHDQITTLEEAPEGDPQTHPTYLAWAAQARRLTALPMIEAPPVDALSPHWIKNRIKGRKWRQILAFSQIIAASEPPGDGPVVDWCGGKGHLGRSLGVALERPVTIIERDPVLAPAARLLAGKLAVALRFEEVDALSEAAATHLVPGCVAVGLHACGALTTALLRESVARDVGLLVSAPCCHDFLAGAAQYAPMSALGRSRDLSLTRDQLRLSIADEVVAPRRERVMRQRDLAWRQAFDLLVREATGRDTFTAAGPVSAKMLRGRFETFCQTAAEHAEVALPARWDPASAEAVGYARAREARALGLVRALFRRPMEVWVGLDRAMFLLEAGRRCRAGLFCPRAVTPRNIALVSASR